MKISIKKLITLATAIAMTTTGALTLDSIKTEAAANVATVNPGVVARLYTLQGNLITNRALAPNTPWLVGNIVNINGWTYYQVATNEYLKESDARLNVGNEMATGTVTNGDAPIYYSTTKGDVPKARTLPNGSKWKVDRGLEDDSGKLYYEIANNEWVSDKNMTVNRAIHITTVNYVFTDYATLGF